MVNLLVTDRKTHLRGESIIVAVYTKKYNDDLTCAVYSVAILLLWPERSVKLKYNPSILICILVHRH